MGVHQKLQGGCTWVFYTYAILGYVGIYMYPVTYLSGIVLKSSRVVQIGMINETEGKFYTLVYSIFAGVVNNTKT